MHSRSNKIPITGFGFSILYLLANFVANKAPTRRIIIITNLGFNLKLFFHKNMTYCSNKGKKVIIKVLVPTATF